MTGSRRIQRSVRVTVATTLMVVAVVLVGAAVVTSVLVAPAALLGMVAGVGATRIMYSEVTQTRWLASCQRAEHARSFQAVMDRSHADHLTYTTMMARRLGDRDRTIGELGGTLRLLERRVDEAEARVRREARRANEAQERLAAVLDEVLGTGEVDSDVEAEADVLAERGELPTIVDLLGWDAKATASRSVDFAETDAATVA